MRRPFLERHGISRNTKGKSVKRLALVVTVLCLGGCGLRTGPINKPPTPTGVEKPVRVTVSRIPSVMGWPVPMIVTIDGVETYGLWSGQSYSFQMEPGEHLFGYFLGFNECNKFIRIGRKPSQRILLGPPCRIRAAD